MAVNVKLRVIIVFFGGPKKNAHGGQRRGRNEAFLTVFGVRRVVHMKVRLWYEA